MEEKRLSQKELLSMLKEWMSDKKIDIQQELSICLSDLPKDHMTKSAKGKIYINISVGMRKEPDQWGRDLKVYVTPTKKDREEKQPKTYVGGGKTFIFSDVTATPITDEDVRDFQQPEGEGKDDDLPF